MLTAVVVAAVGGGGGDGGVRQELAGGQGEA